MAFIGQSKFCCNLFKAVASSGYPLLNNALR